MENCFFLLLSKVFIIFYKRKLFNLLFNVVVLTCTIIIPEKFMTWSPSRWFRCSSCWAVADWLLGSHLEAGFNHLPIKTDFMTLLWLEQTNERLFAPSYPSDSLSISKHDKVFISNHFCPHLLIKVSFNFLFPQIIKSTLWINNFRTSENFS